MASSLRGASRLKPPQRMGAASVDSRRLPAGIGSWQQPEHLRVAQRIGVAIVDPCRGQQIRSRGRITQHLLHRLGQGESVTHRDQWPQRSLA